MYMLLVLLAAVLFSFGTVAKGILIKAEPYRVVVIGAVYGAVGCFVIFAINAVLGDGFTAQLSAAADEMSKVLAQNSQYAELIGLGDKSPAELQEAYKSLYKAALSLLPSTVIVWSTVISYIEYLIISRISIKKGKNVLKMTPVREFSMNKNGFLGWFVICMLAFALNQFHIVSFAETVFVNIYILFKAAFAYQGISFIACFFHMRKWPKPLWIILSVILLLGGTGTIILYIIGIMDAIFNLKGRIGAGR